MWAHMCLNDALNSSLALDCAE